MTANTDKRYSEEQWLKWNARIIENCWISFRNREKFNSLKRSICSAEDSLSTEIIRRLCPRELALFTDQMMQAKVKFRFGGESFPPVVYFKIFQRRVGIIGSQYISGKQLLNNNMSAARSACELMGQRTFYTHLTQDAVEFREHSIADDAHMATMKDYMKRSSFMDDLPAYLGGRDNSWRQLTLQVLPRHTKLYDVMNELYDKSSIKRKTQGSMIRAKPNADSQLQQLLNVSSSTSRSSTSSETSCTFGNKSFDRNHSNSTSQRSHHRSKQAKERIDRMRKLYRQEMLSADLPTGSFPPTVVTSSTTCEEYNMEAQDLFEWSQSLDIS